MITLIFIIFAIQLFSLFLIGSSIYTLSSLSKDIRSLSGELSTVISLLNEIILETDSSSYTKYIN